VGGENGGRLYLGVDRPVTTICRSRLRNACGCENGPADTSPLIEREGYEDSQGVVTHVPPLHGVAIDEVLRRLQKQPQGAHGDDAADLLTAGSADEEQQERRARKSEDVDSAMQAHERCGPDGLQGTEDQEL
jgi:hypothetical protein